MRRPSVSPRHKYVKRVFVVGWTKCLECGDEVCLERMWRYDPSESAYRTSFRNFFYFCSFCTDGKEEVLRLCDARKAPKPPPMPQVKPVLEKEEKNYESS